MNILYKYKNGNTINTLYKDGTLERVFTDKNVIVDFPSSIDLKITNYCDAKCSYCHEQSTTQGEHCDINKLLSVINVLPAGVELAIGGGSAQSHPDFSYFISTIRQKGYVPNITVNQKHLKQDYNIFKKHINDIFGIGISYSSSSYLEDIEEYIKLSDNIVFHLIMGINKISDIDTLNSLCKKYNKQCKVLVLGYKYYGFGINYYVKNKSIEDNKYQWFIKIPKYIGKDVVVSFDNLAIDQLKLKRLFTEEGWKKFYMGDDFTFTMYIDAVKQEYAPTSTSKNRIPFEKMDLLTFFNSYKNTWTNV